MNKGDVHASWCAQANEVFRKKNADYGDSYAQMRKRYPNVIGMKLWEKVNRLCTVLDSSSGPQVTDESVEDTLMDIANYALMELTERTLDKSADKIMKEVTNDGDHSI